MRILMGHNYYKQRGGEDFSFEDECAILEENGHDVIRFTRHNDVIEHDLSKWDAALQSFWSTDTVAELRRLFSQSRPDVAIFVNTFPLISPSAYAICHDIGIPVIQQLRNYRLICANGLLFRDGHPCNKCIDKTFGWPGIFHACYHDSPWQSAAVAAMTAAHRIRGTWAHDIDLFVVPSEFAKHKFIDAGMPGAQIHVKVNYVRFAPSPRTGPGEYALFVGRLSWEKGIDLILKTWRDLDDIPLHMIGDGPMREQIVELIQNAGLQQVKLLGQLPMDQVLEQMRGAAFLVFASQAYETFGRVIIEAFTCGIPVICIDLGAPAELVTPGKTGLHFQPNSSAELAKQVRTLWNDVNLRQKMGIAARQTFEEHYNAEQAYENLMDSISLGIERHQSR